MVFGSEQAKDRFVQSIKASGAEGAGLKVIAADAVVDSGPNTLERTEKEIEELANNKDENAIQVYALKAFHYAVMPVEKVLHQSMEWCDVKNPEKKDMWVQCFGTSMAWLALFS